MPATASTNTTPLAKCASPRVDAPAGHHGEGVVSRHFDAIGGAKAWGKLSGMTTEGSVEFGGGMSLQHKSGQAVRQENPAIASNWPWQDKWS